MASKKAGAAKATGNGSENWSRRNFAPVLFLSINNTPADDLLGRLTKFEYHRTKGKVATAKWTFRNDDRKLLEDRRLLPNTDWEYRFGFYNDMSRILHGLVREVEPDYSMERNVVITLYDAGSVALTRSSSKNWKRVTSSYIAGQIAKKYGWRTNIEESSDLPEKAHVQPGNMSDMAYLRDLASLIDYDVFVIGSPPVLHFRKKDYGAAPRGTLVYYDDATDLSYLKSFKPKVKSLGPLAAGASSASDKDKDHKKDKSDDPSKKNPALAVGVNFNAQGASRSLVVVPVKGKDDITRSAPSHTNTRNLAEVARQQMLDRANEATSSHPLTPSLEYGLIFTIAGVDKQIDGKWFIVDEKHVIDGKSMKTEIGWQRNSTGASNAKKAANKNNKDSDGGGSAPVVQVTLGAGGANSVSVLPPGGTGGAKNKGGPAPVQKR